MSQNSSPCRSKKFFFLSISPEIELSSLEEFKGSRGWDR
jgi:hypothetical protein